ncbi:stromal interaction molecule 1-like isoform X2 [Anneissia japonica]|uniref:stromal interaction molecule 1-like isoform X2 n=1 Tax=Anneissia japonica TaxID=1529436 RepID=UPI001425A53F|nr:stromal interaction molecule 1-like isoform X2 [Anneissia japonica]
MGLYQILICLLLLITFITPYVLVSGGECSAKDNERAEDERDKLAKEAIEILHRKIDDDENGDLDLYESDEFLREELEYGGDFERHESLFKKDQLINKEDLWNTWSASQVCNWTTGQMVGWLVDHLDLKQYVNTFEVNAVDGKMLPRLAVNHAQIIQKVLGISNPVHRHKISINAMDVVLFGPPKQHNSYIKDWTLVISVVLAVGGCWFAYVQHRYSQYHAQQMMKELESLQKAEDSLREYQERLEREKKEHQMTLQEKSKIEAELNAKAKEVKEKEFTDGDSSSELQEKLLKARADFEEMSQGFFKPSAALQQWLQLTYEVEVRYYNTKRTAAERQLMTAKEVCEKIRKKRSTFLGSFRIAHSGTLDDIDQRIVSARSSLHEVTSDLKERLHRWSQIEQLCNFSITNNNGYNALRLMLFGLEDSVKVAESTLSMGIEEGDEDVPPNYLSVTGGTMTPSSSSSQLLKLDNTLSGSLPNVSRKPVLASPSEDVTFTLGDESDQTGGSVSLPSSISMNLGQQRSTTTSVLNSNTSNSRPKSLPISHSDGSLRELSNSNGTSGKKGRKDAYKKASRGILNEEDTMSIDGSETEGEVKKKRKIRIPVLHKVEKLKTC